MAIKFGLYSISYLGCWYKDRPLTICEVLDKAAEFGFDGVELDAKRPHANPMDLSPVDRIMIKNKAAELGLELPMLAANNNFSSPVPERREAELFMVTEQIKLAADLGCKYLRIFGAWSGITFRDGWAHYDEASRNAQIEWSGVPRSIRMGYIKECIAEAVTYAERYGVILVLQNHPPILRNWRDVYEIVSAIDSPYLKICFDVPHNEDDTVNVQTAMKTIGDLDVHFHYNGEFTRDDNGSGKVISIPTMFGEPIKNYKTLVKELLKINYNGYICWEYCHNVIDPKGEPGKIEDVDNMTKLALEYMRDIVREAESEM